MRPLPKPPSGNATPAKTSAANQAVLEDLMENDDGEN